jgi:hypothetical protein
VWVLARRLGEASVTFKRILPIQQQSGADGLSVQQGVLYRAGTFWLLVLTIDNAADQEPWVPTEAMLTPVTPTPTPVAVRTVSLEEGPLAPGARGRLAVETDVPPAAAGTAFQLTVRSAGGRQLIYTVFIPKSGKPEGEP